MTSDSLHLRTTIIYVSFNDTVLSLWGGGPQISKNLGASSKFGEPEGWHKAIIPVWPASLTVIWRFLIGACEMMYTLERNRPTTAMIILKILHSTVQNVVTRAIWRVGFMHQWSRVLWKTATHTLQTSCSFFQNVEARNQAKSDSVKNSAFLLIAVLFMT
jgi:hypothetical protein